MLSLRRALVLVTAIPLLAASAVATTVLRQSLESLTDRAEIVVRGSVERVEGHAEVEGHPFRLAVIRVDETFAGDAPARIAIRLPGGASLDGTPMMAAGVPELVAGDEVVVFLTRVPPGVAQEATRPAGGELAGARGRVAPATGPPAAQQWTIVSLAIGSYRVERRDGRTLAVHDAAARGIASAGQAPPEGLAPDEIEMDALESRVKGRRAQQGRR